MYMYMYMYMYLYIMYMYMHVHVYVYVYVYIIDQARCQDGWVLAEFSFCVLWTETKSRSIKTQKENEANTQPS